MFKKALVILASVSILLALSACGKSKEEQAKEQARNSELENFSQGVTPPPVPAPLPKDLAIDVPAPIKAKYKAVTMGIGFRKKREVKKFTVGIGETASVPDTDYTIRVTAYLPNWHLSGNKVTSKNDVPDDPAVRATIFQKDKQVFDGFIFQKNKTPSFITDDYVIGLLGAVAK